MTLYDLVEPGLDTCDEPRYRTAGIRAADPLGADALLAAVPGMNDDAGTAALAVALRVLVPDPDRVADWNVVECLAAMRDLGLLLGSLKRHGVQPVAAVPEVLPVLRELGRRTDTVPRGTVRHYTTWNPPGRRRRTYTGTRTEARLQDAVRTVFPGLAAAPGTCDRLARLDPYDPGSALAPDHTARHVRSTADAIDFTAALGRRSAGRVPQRLAASAASLARVLRLLKTFRARHLGIARQAYRDDLRLCGTGSGGAPVALLRSVLDLTRDNETLVRRAAVPPRTPAA